MLFISVLFNIDYLHQLKNYKLHRNGKPTTLFFACLQRLKFSPRLLALTLNEKAVALSMFSVPDALHTRFNDEQRCM